jgi:cell division protein FtsI (penicillin-binding protein 3)
VSYAARNPALRLKLEGWRARLLLVVMLLSFVGLGARSAYLQSWKHDFLQRKGEARFSRVVQLPANRGLVLDRDGNALAISTPMESVVASPAEVAPDAAKLAKLAKLIGLSGTELEEKLQDKERGFVYLRRQIPPHLAAEVAALKLTGVSLQREYRRYYPSSDVLAHVVGFTDVNDKGQEGIELAFQDWLAGSAGAKRVIKDRAGHVVEDVESIRLPQDGKPVTLSIDSKIQYRAHRELKAAVRAHRARAGSLVVLDTRTGEILALASVPDYNPNNRARVNLDQVRNRPVTDTFEPGSTLKPFTVAIALERGVVRPQTRIQTAPGYLKVGDRTIRDAHRHDELTVSEIIQKSSNIGSAKIALELPRQAMWEFLSAVGFGAPPHSGFPGEVTGRLRAHESWRPIEQATMSYGHGISVSLLQLARAYTVFATAGEVLPISILKTDPQVAATRVVSTRTAEAVTRMLELVVQPGGTAPKAQVVGYRVAGKTGTSLKQVGSHYATDKYVSSFVGFAPVSNPRLLIAVMIDEPRAGEHYGGEVAAPLFSKVMGDALRLLSITPDAPLQEWNTSIEGAPVVEEGV